MTTRTTPHSVTFGTPLDYKLDVFQGETILRFLRKHNIRPLFCAILPIGLLVVVVIIAGLSDTLTQSNLTQYVCHDVASLFPRRPAWGCVKSYSSNNHFNLLRDIPSMITILIAGAEPILIYKQWLGFEELFPSMIRNNLLRAEDDDAVECLRKEVKSSNQFFLRVGRMGSILSLLATLFILPITTSERVGVYSIFYTAQQDASATYAESYKLWWASFNSHPTNWAIYSIILVIGIYAAIVMNVIAVRPILILWRIRHKITPVANADNPDGYWGWAQPREILISGYLATALYGLAIISVSLTLTDQARWVLLPFALQWIIVLPFHLYVPLSFTRRSISKFKRAEIERLSSSLALLQGDNSTEAERSKDFLGRRLKLTRDIKTFPFQSFKDLGAASLVFIASLCSIYAVFGPWYQLP